MARRTPQTHAKRQRELAKAEKRLEKAEKRALRKSLKSQGSENTLEEGKPKDPESESSDPPIATPATSG